MESGAAAAGRVYLSGRYGARNMWAEPAWEGKPSLGPYRLPDGRDITAVIADGDIDDLPFPVWFRRSRGTRQGDLLWAGGLSTKLASRRFVEVLDRIGATGYRTFEVTFIDRKRTPLDGYIGIASTGSDPDLDITHFNGFQNSGLHVKRHVLDALLAAGVDGFDVSEP